MPPAGVLGRITAASVWQMPATFLPAAHAACEKFPKPQSFTGCFIDQMSKAGAPPAAVAFTQTLLKQSGGDFGVMSGFNAVGPVDVAFVTYPLRANTNNGILFVNGTPEDRQRREPASCSTRPPCSRARSSRTPRRNFPRSTLWPGDRDGTTWPNANTNSEGGKSFTLGYPCSTAATPARSVGTAEFNWKFGPTGKFLGTVFMGMTPPPVQ